MEVAAADGMALLTVSDAGQGLPQHMADGPFERFPHPAGRRSEGSGLGLSIVRALAERQQGRVRVESRPEGGTRFVVQLPRANVA